MSTSVAMGPGREFDAIRELLAEWGDAASGIGDDGAVLEFPAGERLVVSTDSAIEDVHFRRDWLAPHEIGYRAVAAALSDLAAMGARALGVVVALTLPEGWRGVLRGLGKGIGEAARESDAPIVGGNISTGRELTLTTTVFGAAARPLTRGGARPGDHVYVTGALGGAGVALASFLRGEVPNPMLRSRFVHPDPRIPEGQWLAEHGATAAVDISDGLLADLGHLAAASAVRITVDLARVPTVPGIDARTAARSGEEYELALTGPRLDTGAFRDAWAIPLTAIGRVIAGPPGVEALYRGERVAEHGGHDHLSG